MQLSESQTACKIGWLVERFKEKETERERERERDLEAESNAYKQNVRLIYASMTLGI